MKDLNKLTIYHNIVDEVNNEYESLQYLTYDFFKKYVNYLHILFIENDDNKASKYYKDYIFTSNLYNKNSCCYCRFLEVAYYHQKELINLYY